MLFTRIYTSLVVLQVFSCPIRTVQCIWVLMEPLFSSVRYFQVLVWSRYLRPCRCWSLGIHVCARVVFAYFKTVYVLVSWNWCAWYLCLVASRAGAPSRTLSFNVRVCPYVRASRGCLFTTRARRKGVFDSRNGVRRPCISSVFSCFSYFGLVSIRTDFMQILSI